MRRRILIFVSILFVVSTCAFASVPQATPAPSHPLERETLLALVAGGSLPENIIWHIENDGLAFQPDQSFRTLLTTAGADPSILKALSSAKVNATEPAPQADDLQRLQDLANAGQLIGEKKYDDAAKELAAEVTGSFHDADAGFVMAHVLILQRRYDEAGAIYAELLEEDPDFPELHTEFSFALFETGDEEQSLVEANKALAVTPNNPRAHADAGLALYEMQKYDAAEAQYKEALRIKPDFSAAYTDLGNLYGAQKKYDEALAQYRKALHFEPDDAMNHYDLACTLDDKGDLDAAIPEYRIAIRLDPTWFDPRENLGADLMKRRLYPEAVIQFREQEKLFPESEMCHECLGNALYDSNHMDDALAEYRTAARLDPSNPDPHLSIGNVLEYQKDLDGALKEYVIAEQLDQNSDFAYRAAGRIYLAKKDYPDALQSLKQAVSLAPADSLAHDLLGQAFEASDQSQQAVSEFKESLLLDPTKAAVRVRYAQALEKSGDRVGALEQFRQASLDAPADDSTQAEYKAARQRFDDYLKILKAEGKSSEASSLDASVRASDKAPSVSQSLDAAIAAGDSAVKNNQLDDAVRHYNKAVQLAESLEPHDGRLGDVLGKLGQIYSRRSQFALANATFQQQIAAIKEINGPNNPGLADPIYSMGMCAISQKDFVAGEKLIIQAIQITENFFGEHSNKVLIYMTTLSQAYTYAGQYEEAIPYLQKTIQICKDSPDVCPLHYQLMANTIALAGIYNKLGKFDLAESTLHEAITEMESQYGPNSTQLLFVLDKEQGLLQQLGRTADAAAIGKRIAAIKAASPNPLQPTNP
jgi:tetratricopeptide (TPR) repeat protein